MKNIYVSPEAKLLCFAAAEQIAAGEVNFDDLMGGDTYAGVSTDVDVDIDIDIGI